MRQCKVCKENKTLDEFPKNSKTKLGVLHVCKPCWSVKKAKDYKYKWFVYQARLKKAVCKKNGLPYDLTPEYLKSIWTDNCPVFNKPFVKHDKSSDMCPALDRITPSKGYTQGNVVYISARANRIKYDANVEELKQVLSYLEGATTISKESTPKRVEAPDPT